MVVSAELGEAGIGIAGMRSESNPSPLRLIRE
jgi:hypothetical protein